MVAKTSKGQLEQYLTFPLPSIYLWAFSSTPSDVNVRKKVALQLGYLSGIQKLVELYPGGSIEGRIDELKALRPDLPPDGIVDLLVDEIVNKSAA